MSNGSVLTEDKCGGINMKTIKILAITMFLIVFAYAAKKVYVHVIDQAICTQCGDCVMACPEKAIKVTKKADGKIMHEIDPALCTQCGICIDKCKVEAISAVEQKVVPQKKDDKKKPDDIKKKVM